MRLKTYMAPTTADALSQVRADLGDEAVIVSIVEEGDEVTVTAALEDKSFDDVQDSPALEHTVDEDFSRVCEQHNFTDELVRDLINVGVSGNENRLEYSLKHVLHFQDVMEPHDAPIVLVGPPGVGKTVTLAKLAVKAQCADQPIHLITTDIQKAGAVEQLLSYGKALDIDVHVSSSMDNLWSAVQNAPKEARVMVDTPGINPFREDELRALTEIILTMRVSPILVMPAGGDIVDHMDMMKAFQNLGARRVLLTRVDLARRLGGVVDALYRSRMKCVGINASPFIADALIEGNAHELAQLLREHGNLSNGFDYDWHKKEAV